MSRDLEMGSSMSEAQKMIFNEYIERLRNIKHRKSGKKSGQFTVKNLSDHWVDSKSDDEYDQYDFDVSTIYAWTSGQNRFTNYYLLWDIFPGIGETQFRSSINFLGYLYKIDGERLPAYDGKRIVEVRISDVMKKD